MSAQIEFKDTSFEIKLLGDESEPGTLTGYCAAFGNIDRAGEVILKGAFASTLDEFKRLGFLCDGHDHCKEIGTIESAQEDDRGLLITARFFSTPDAQIIRQKVKEKLSRGSTPGMSIGYRVLDDELKSGIRYLKEIELLEASVVSIPANTHAAVAAVKAFDPEGEGRGARLRRLYFDHLLNRHAPGVDERA